MSEREDEFVPAPEDPFRASDPEAIERARRRAQREARRAQRANRASLGERVSGALDGVTARGRVAIEHGRERVAAPREPPPEAPEPPPFRRASAKPEEVALTTAPREEVAPAPREDVAPTTAPHEDAAPTSRENAASTPTSPTTPPDPLLHGETDDFAPPAPIPAGLRNRSASTVERDEIPDIRRSRNDRFATRRAARPASGSIWIRRLLALAAVVLIVAGAAFAISQAGGGGDDPAPVARGPAKLKTIDLTIPEGLSRAEMAAIADDAGLKGDYEKETAKPPRSFDTKRIGFPDGVSLEGFLFPATYNLEQGAPAKDLVGQQLEAFDQNIAQVDLKAAAKKNLTTYDVVTIASMIEREVQVAKERPLVGAVIYNRLADDEALGIDATLRYEVGFDEPLTESQLAADSPYNTRINPGLPPTPIGNPGLASLEAAADPANVDFKYYVYKPGTCGEHAFTADYDEFINLSNEYQAALEAAGGQPDSC